MKRVWGHVLTGLAMAGAIAAAGVFPACAHDDSTLYVSNVLAPPFISPGNACIYTADPTQPHIAAGTVDVGLRGSYDAVMLIANQMVSRADPSAPATETSTITIEGATVRITDALGAQIKSYTTRVGITVPPSTGVTPGYSVVGATIVDTGTLASLNLVGHYGASVPLMTYTKFFGHTLGGDSVESNEFGFPVTACWGCLVTFSAGDINPNFPAPNCIGNASAGSSTSVSIPCTFGQDGTIECTLCQDRDVCRLNEPPLADAGAD